MEQNLDTPPALSLDDALQASQARLRAVLDKTTAAALAVSSARSGNVHADLVRGLAQVLGADAVLIAVFCNDRKTHMRTLAAQLDGRLLRNFEYEVAKTPCRHIVGNQSRFIASGVNAEFAPGSLLGAVGIDSYAGYSLISSEGEQMGIIVALDRRPIVDRELTEALLKIFAARASAEIERTRAEANYRAIFESAEDAIFVHDWESGAFVDVNSKACATYGYTREEMLKLSISDISSNEPPYTVETAVRYMQAARRSGQTQRFEWHRRNRDGSLHWDEVCLKAATLGGRPYILAFTREITERRRAEQALRASEELYRTLFNASADAFVLRDANFRVVDVNAAFVSGSGYSREETIGAEGMPLVSHEENERIRGEHQRALQGETLHFETAGHRKDGTRFEAEVRGMPLTYRGQPHVLYISRDITARKRGERALRQSEEQYRAIFNSSADAMVLRDARFAVVDVNPAYTVMTGYTREETLGADRVLTQSPEANSQRRLIHARVLAGEQVRFETRARRKDGVPFDAEVRAMPVQHRGERHVLYVVRDITEHKRAEQALRDSEEQYRAIFNASADGLFLRDAEFRIVDINPAYLAMKGFTREELVGSTKVLSRRPGEERERRAIHQRVLAGETACYETTAQRKDGSWFDVEVRGMRVVYHGQPHVLYSVRDVTARRAGEREQRRLEAQLRQAQKMEAIGQLTGGIAHDFNNILASIMGYNVLAVERVAAAGDSKSTGYLEEALASCRRARDLIQQMLTFSRGSRSEPRPLQLAALVHDSVPLLRSSLATTIAFDIDARADTPAVLADDVQIGQVLLNLCINARDAMAGSGRLRIGVHSHAASKLTCASCRAAVNGKYVELAVADTGSGIEPQVLDRMFEPFFSTKDTGKGTGMGLAMVHGIVHEHGGHIVVDSEIGRGSTFRIMLPALASNVVYDEHETVRMVRPKRRLSGRVLLVDDETAVRGFMQEMLAGWGLTVTTAAHAGEALSIFEEKEGAFDLVITDLAMPIKTGIELAAELRARCEDVPIILCSGYATDDAAFEAERYGIDTILGKPIEPAELRSAVEAALPA